MQNRRLGCVAVLMVISSGCFKVVDLDSYQEKSGTGTNGGASPSNDSVTIGESDYTNLRVSFVAMKPHAGQMIEFRVVDSRNFIQSRGVVSAMFALDVVINVPLAIPKPNGPYHFDFYADVNFSGGYDGLGSVLANDHAWRVDPLADYPVGITPIEGTVQLRFLHNTSFTDIDQYPSGTPNKAVDTGLGALIHVRGLDALQGKMAQVRIADHGSRHVVATYRVPEIHGATFDAKVSGCVEQGTDYDVDLYVDANGNGEYDDPSKEGGDLGWRVSGTSDETGLEGSVDGTLVDAARNDIGTP